MLHTESLSLVSHLSHAAHG